MAKITLPTIAAGYASNTAFNSAYDLIEAEFQNKVLYRNNTSGETNTMQQALDMDGEAINNCGVLTATGLTVAGVSLTTKVAEAAASATAAASSATAAASSATAAAASYDSFDDRYLGAKGSAPTVDNDGGALLTGAIYFNTSSNQIFAWTAGDAWVAIKPTSSEQTAITAVAADATDIGAVAGKATEIGRLGTSAAVADMAILATDAIVADMALLATDAIVADMALLASDAVIADMAILGTSDVVTDMNVLGTADVVNDMNILGSSAVVADMNLLGTSANVTAMGLLGTSTVISNIANVSANVAGVNSFADLYRGAAGSDPTGTITTGSLYYNTGSPKQLKIYDGSNWVNAAFSASGAVTAFNSRTGAVTLSSGDVTTALGFTPQTVNANLTAIAGLTSAANKGVQFTGSGSAAVYDLTTAGKALLDDADAAAQRTTLGLGTAAVLATGISDTNVPKFTSGVADDDFLKVAGTAIEGRSAAEVLSDIGGITASSSDTLSNKSIAASQLTGTIATARLGSGTASSSTFLAGDQTYKTISSNPEKLVKDFTLTSGKTVTAGKMVSVASNGEVGTLPTLNTTGTYRATAGTENQYYGSGQPGNGSPTAYNGWGGISLNGSRGLRVGAYSGSTTSRVVTIYGYAFANDANRVTGSTTVTLPIPNNNASSKDAYTGNYISNGGAWCVYVQPVSDTKFMCIAQSSGINAAGNTWHFNYNAAIITVDASGNLSKGTVANDTYSTTYSGIPGWVQVGYFRRWAHDTVGSAHDSAETGWVLSAESTYALKRFYVYDGSNSVAIYKANHAVALMSEVYDGFSNGAHNCIRTTGNKLVWCAHFGARSISISNADGGIGLNATVTSQSLAAVNATTTGTGVALVGDQWTGGITNPVARDSLAFHGYNHTGDSFRVYTPFSVNASTGALTNDKGTWSSGSTDGLGIRATHWWNWMTNTAQTQAVSLVTRVGVTYVNSFELNSKGVPIGANLGLELVGGTTYTLTQARNLTGSTWLLFIRSGATQTTTQVTVDFNVAAASTLPINFVGFPTATDSSTPASIVVKGVASGFSSLTPGAIYYQSTANNGTITTVNSSGVIVGKAISSTEILIDRDV